jgi:hypothetical protein
MKLVHFAFTCLIVGATSAVAQGSKVNFANPVTYPSGGQDPTQVVVADVNGDRIPDLIVADYCASDSSNCPSANGSVAVLLGNGNGTFQMAVVYDSGGADATSVAVADVNGDGYPDLIVTNSCASISSCTNGTVGILLNNGNGTFQPAVTFNSGGEGAASVAAADLTGNGKLDLIVGDNCAVGNSNGCLSPDYSPGMVGVLLGNGDGTFQTPTVYDSGASYAWSVSVADLRSDGKLDIVVATGIQFLGGVYSGEVGVLLGNGDGTFRPAVVYNTGGYTTPGRSGVAVADVNGDGKPDLVVANSCGPDHTCSGEENSSVGVLLGNGDGTFKTVVTYDSGQEAEQGLAVADLNGDGVPDIAATGGATLELLLGVGNGTFAPPVGFLTGGSFATSVAAADLNGDDKTDLVVTNQNSSTIGTIGVLINTVVALSPGVLNFGGQAPGTTSSPLGTTLTNTGATTLNISSFAITGPNANQLSQTNTCSTSLAAGQACTINVTFAPMTFGTANATLDVSDNAAGSPQTVQLSGLGSGPGVSLSPTALSFPSQLVGTSSHPQIVTLTNTGNSTLAISSVTASLGDFSVVNGCGSSVAAGADCSIGVIFDPTQPGTRNATLSVTDNASGVPQPVTLSGIGQGFSMASSGSSTATISPGQTANYSISISPDGGFNQTVALRCTGAPTGATCTLPASVTLNGSSPTTINVAVTTSGNTVNQLFRNLYSLNGRRLAVWWFFPGLTGLLLGAARRRRARRGAWIMQRVVFWCLIWLAIGLASCGGSGSNNGTAYNLTVEGAFAALGSNPLTQSIGLTLIVK